MMITTPEVPGYITENTVVGGKTVTPDDCDREYTVEYKVNEQPSTNEQKVIVSYVDFDDENREIVADTLTGQANMLVDYDPKKTIGELEKQGYTLVENGYNPIGEVQFFSNNDDYVPTFNVTMKHRIGQVDADHPSDKVDKNEYVNEVSFFVNYEGAGSDTPADNVQKARWSRGLTVDLVTGEVFADGQYTTGWQVDRENYDDVPVPVVAGYHADKKVVAGGKVTKESVTKKVAYTANGHIIPVDADGNSCDIKTTAPYNPAKDLEVTYKPKKTEDTWVIPVGQKTEKAKAEKPKQEQTTTPEKKEESKPGESINDLYSTEIPLKAIAQTGYHVVFNGFDGDGQIQKFNSNDLMTQVFTVGLSKLAKSETKAKAPEKQSDVDLDAVREATINNKDTAAMALDIAATIISLIGVIGKENK